VKLPDQKIGISDINDFRECPRRWEFGMRRWSEEGEAPEARSANTAYGSAIHDILHWIEEDGLDDDAAIQRGFDEHGTWLDPEHLERMREDLATYHERDPIGVELVGSEIELSMPITTWSGEEVRFRGRIDRLYRRLDNPSVFIAKDYKSSAHRKTEAEVHKDPQQWAYNVLIHDFYPECQTLIQIYDQLRFGEVATSKNDAQRKTMREWLERQVRAILAAEKAEPKLNDWCAYCSILESCPIIKRLSRYALAEIAAVAPEEKVGRKTEVGLDPELFDLYVEELPTASKARAALERYEKAVKKVLLKMPAARRAQYGYRLSERTVESFPPEALMAVHREMGDEFYDVISMPKSAIERAFSDEPERIARILQMASRSKGATSVLKADRT
jgi:hypothetical protein